uniref:Uncharacterized protein n=1 Tax=Anthurium amnicola TaxID=1678845 RepID=A0A1D1YWB8_9ARAE
MLVLKKDREEDNQRRLLRHPHHHHHHHQYHHRQHHHHQHHNPYIDLAPAPAPQYNDVIPPPGGQTGCPPKSNSRSYFDPIAPSVTSHHYSAPHLQGKSPAPISVTPPESSHIPNVLFTQVEPPSKSTHPAKLHDKVPSSCTTAILHYIHWSFALPFYLLACL